MEFLHIISRKQAKELGIKFYFTGKKCKNDHIAVRRTDNGSCLLCSKEGQKEYSKKYYIENKDDIRQRNIEWRNNNKDRVKELLKQYTKKNKDKIIRERKENLERSRGYNAKRRAKMRQSGGSFKKKDIDDMFVAQSGLCVACGVNLITSGYHIDHKIPLSKGGTNWIDNIQLLCPSCNLSKNNKDYDLWLAEVELNRAKLSGQV